MPEVKIIRDVPPSLEEAQRFVGGLVEILNVHYRFGAEMGVVQGQLLVNEEGLLLKLKPNLEASLLSHRGIVGNAMLLLDDAKWT